MADDERRQDHPEEEARQGDGASGGGDETSPPKQEVEGDAEELSSRRARTLGEILDQLVMAEDGADGSDISLEEVREKVGHRAFGPFLLVVGLLAMTPVGAIPGVPTTLAVIVVLMGAQLLLGLKGLWLPGFVLHRTLSQKKLDTSIRWLRPVAHGVDRVLRPRLEVFTGRPALYVMAAACVLMGVMIPPLEFVPFAVTVPAVALTLFGLALITSDGLVALAAFLLSGASVYLVLSNLVL